MDLNGLFGGQSFDMSVAPKVGGNYTEIPDGLYQILVKGDRVVRFDSGAKLVYDCVIIEGSLKNTEIEIDFVTEHSNTEWIAREMDKMKAFFLACKQNAARSTSDVVNATPIIEVYHSEDKNGKTRNDGTPFKYRNYNFVKRDLSLFTLPHAVESAPATQAQAGNPAAQKPEWMQ